MSKMHAELENGRILIFDSYMVKDSIKEIPGRIWDAQRKVWSVPINTDNVETLKILGCDFNDELKDFYDSFKSENTQGIHTPIMTMPIKATPYQHQIKGFNFACRLMGIEKGGDDPIHSISRGSALLMEM